MNFFKDAQTNAYKNKDFKVNAIAWSTHCKTVVLLCVAFLYYCDDNKAQHLREQ